MDFPAQFENFRMFHRSLADLFQFGVGFGQIAQLQPALGGLRVEAVGRLQAVVLHGRTSTRNRRAGEVALVTRNDITAPVADCQPVRGVHVCRLEPAKCS